MPSDQSFPTTSVARLAGHSGPVHTVTFSAGSGQYILTGSADRSIRLFNATSTKPSGPRNALAAINPIQTFCAHGYEVLDLAVAHDNASFVSVGGDKTVFLWDVATATTLRRFVGHAGRVNCVDFGGGGVGGEGGEQVIVTGSFDGTVRVWDLRSRSEKAIMTLDEARDGVSSVRVRGGEIYAGSVDGRVRVYDLATGFVETDVLGASVTSVTPAMVDGESYLVSTLDSKLRLIDRKNGKCLRTFADPEYRNETYRIRSTLAMGDAYAVAGAEDGSVFVWDVLSGERKARVWHRRDREEGGSKKDVVSAVAWNQMRKMWASAGGDGNVVIWAKGD